MSHVLIPPSTIQPIVENAVEHGLNNVTKNGQISVIIKRKYDMIKISVEDNGIGFIKEEMNKLAKHLKSETSNRGVGVYNVNQRIIGLLTEKRQLKFENLKVRCGKVYLYILIE